jgi:hypothetical protein
VMLIEESDWQLSANQTLLHCVSKMPEKSGP